MAKPAAAMGAMAKPAAKTASYKPNTHRRRAPPCLSFT